MYEEERDRYLEEGLAEETIIISESGSSETTDQPFECRVVSESSGTSGLVSTPRMVIYPKTRMEKTEDRIAGKSPANLSSAVTESSEIWVSEDSDEEDKPKNKVAATMKREIESVSTDSVWVESEDMEEVDMCLLGW